MSEVYGQSRSNKRSYAEEGGRDSRYKRDDYEKRSHDYEKRRYESTSNRERDSYRDRRDSHQYRDSRSGRDDRSYREERPRREDRPKDERSRHRSPRGEVIDHRQAELREQKSRSFKSIYHIDFTNRPTLFDLAPPGYEKTPVSEYKTLKAAGSLPAMAVPQGSTIIPRARRLYLEKLPENLNEADFITAINQELKKRGACIKPGDAALYLDLSEYRDTAYIYFRSSEETNSALELDGFVFNDTSVKISRPNDYQPHNGYYFGCPHVFQDTLNKLFVACVPVHLTDDQVKELLTAFGELKAFNLVKDGASGLSKGYAFCEYRDGSVTDIAIAGLNGMQIADKKLVVQRAVLGSRAGTNLGGIIPTQMQVPDVDPDHIISHDLLVTEVLCLLNMVTKKDLLNDIEYEEILQDVREECSKFGEVLSVNIPRPDPSVNEDTFIGRVFVEFGSKDHCKEAHETLAGRKFNDRLVLTTFYDTDKYRRGDY